MSSGILYVSMPRSTLTMGREPFTITSGRLCIMLSMVSESLGALACALTVMDDAKRRLIKKNLLRFICFFVKTATCFFASGVKTTGNVIFLK